MKIDIFTYHLIKKLGRSDLQWGDRIPVYRGRRITAICTRALVDRPVAPLRLLLARVFTDTVYNSFLLDVSQMRSVTSSMDSTHERSLRQVRTTTERHFSLPRDVTQQINLRDVRFGGTTASYRASYFGLLYSTCASLLLPDGASMLRKYIQTKLS